jgi:8-oxo-dGTP pyrophosphatase MutT (NUDIX family)
MAKNRFMTPVAVHLFLFNNSGQVLLLRRCNTGYEDGNYSVPAGHIDGGETAPEAMLREAEEETGISILPEVLQPVGVMHRRNCADAKAPERIDFFFVTDKWTGRVDNRELQKCDDLSFFDLDNLPSNMVPYVRRALTNYRAGRWFDTFGF